MSKLTCLLAAGAVAAIANFSIRSRMPKLQNIVIRQGGDREWGATAAKCAATGSVIAAAMRVEMRGDATVTRDGGVIVTPGWSSPRHRRHRHDD